MGKIKIEIVYANPSAHCKRISYTFDPIHLITLKDVTDTFLVLFPIPSQLQKKKFFKIMQIFTIFILYVLN